MKRYTITEEEMRVVAASLHDHLFQPEEVHSVLIITQRTCRDCGLPHITTLSGTPTDRRVVVGMLATALNRAVMEWDQNTDVPDGDDV